MEKLYKDPEVLKMNPLMKAMHLVLKNAALRPARQTRTRYSQVSSIFWNAVHRVISGTENATTSFKTAEEKLNHLSRKGTRWK